MSYAYFLAQIALIYILSRRNINEFFQTAYFFLRKETLAYFCIAFIFFPGTLVHEAAHAVMALILFLRVRSVELFPHKQGNGLRLGSVLYEKKDPVRALIVGIAPFFAGILFFWIIANFKLFTITNFYLSLAVGYLIFAISSTMFSSKQDLKDILIASPILLIIFGLVYVVFGWGWLKFFSPSIESFLQYINLYLLFCVIIHIILFITLRTFNNVFIRR